MLAPAASLSPRLSVQQAVASGETAEGFKTNPELRERLCLLQPAFLRAASTCFGQPPSQFTVAHSAIGELLTQLTHVVIHGDSPGSLQNVSRLRSHAAGSRRGRVSGHISKAYAHGKIHIGSSNRACFTTRDTYATPLSPYIRQQQPHVCFTGIIPHQPHETGGSSASRPAAGLNSSLQPHLSAWCTLAIATKAGDRCGVAG